MIKTLESEKQEAQRIAALYKENQDRIKLYNECMNPFQFIHIVKYNIGFKLSWNIIRQ